MRTAAGSLFGLVWLSVARIGTSGTRTRSGFSSLIFAKLPQPVGQFAQLQSLVRVKLVMRLRQILSEVDKRINFAQRQFTHIDPCTIKVRPWEESVWLKPDS
jgi:hypothetical protein